MKYIQGVTKVFETLVALHKAGFGFIETGIGIALSSGTVRQWRMVRRTKRLSTGEVVYVDTTTEKIDHALEKIENLRFNVLECFYELMDFQHESNDGLDEFSAVFREVRTNNLIKLSSTEKPDDGACNGETVIHNVRNFTLWKADYVIVSREDAIKDLGFASLANSYPDSKCLMISPIAKELGTNGKVVHLCELYQIIQYPPVMPTHSSLNAEISTNSLNTIYSEH